MASLDRRVLQEFVDMYGCGLDPEDEPKHYNQLPISARMAYYLWITATELHDHWREWAQHFDPDDHNNDWEALLPPLAVRHADAAWLARLAQCYGDVAQRLRSGAFGDYGVTTCTGDEAAMRVTVAFAADLVADNEIYTPLGFEEVMPSCGNEDIDFDMAIDMLGPDDDVLVLWDPAQDGVEPMPPTAAAITTPRPSPPSSRGSSSPIESAGALTIFQRPSPPSQVRDTICRRSWRATRPGLAPRATTSPASTRPLARISVPALEQQPSKPGTAPLSARQRR